MITCVNKMFRYPNNSTTALGYSRSRFKTVALSLFSDSFPQKIREDGFYLSKIAARFSCGAMCTLKDQSERREHRPTLSSFQYMAMSSTASVLSSHELHLPRTMTILPSSGSS